MSNLTNSHSKPQRLLAFLLAFLFVFTSMVTIFPTHAYADETPPVTPGGPNLDGDAQDGVAGSDSDKDNSWDGSGAWRVYIAESNDTGTIKYDPIDLSNQAYPWRTGVIGFGMMDKLHSRSSSFSSNKEEYDPRQAENLPSLGASQAALKEYWEQSDYWNISVFCITMRFVCYLTNS